MTKYLALAAVAATSAIMAMTPAHADQYRSGSQIGLQTVGYSSYSARKYSYNKYRFVPRHYYAPRYTVRPYWGFRTKKHWNRYGWNSGRYNRWN